VLLALVLLACACGDRAGEEARTPSSVEAIAGPAEGIPSWAKVAPEQVAAAAEHGVPVAFENDLGMRFVLIPAGTFSMGSSPEHARGVNAVPQHTVEMPEPYYIQTTEVTNRMFRTWRPHHDSGRTKWALDQNKDEQPVRTSFDAACGFADWLTGVGGERCYRLPTEAEWERACRAGTSSRYYWGESLEGAHRYENFFGPACESRRDSHGYPLPDRDGHDETAPVGTYLPNPWGLYDMLGNAAEWCDDYFGSAGWSEGDPTTFLVDPTAPSISDWRVVRGSYCQMGVAASCAYRDAYDPFHEEAVAGFRLVSPLPESGDEP